MGIRTRMYDNILEWQWKSEHFLAKPPKWTSSYLLDGLLIDTSCPAGSQFIYNWVKSLPKEDAVKKVYLTHFHEDHSGGAYLLQKNLHIPIYAPALTQKIFDEQKKYKLYRRIYWGARNNVPLKLISAERIIESSTGKYSFEVIPIPGHSPDLHALFDKKNQLLFVGDGLVTKYIRIFGGNCPDIQENMEQIYNSQKKLYEMTENYPDIKIMVSHSGIFPQSFIKEKMDEIENLHKKAHEIKKSIPNYEKMSKKKLIHLITSKMWRKGEDTYIKLMTRGELCRGNLTASLLQWNIDSN